MTETHAIAHRECGGPLRVQSVDVGPVHDAAGILIRSTEYRDHLVCQDCDEVIEDIYDEAVSSAGDTEQLAHRLLHGDDVELVDEDPRVWARKTSDDQVSLFEFENEGERA